MKQQFLLLETGVFLANAVFRFESGSIGVFLFSFFS